MIRSSSLLALLIVFSTSLFADEFLNKHIKSFNEDMKKVGMPPKSTYCIETLKSTNPNLATLYSAENNKTIELSILSESRAKDVFNKLKNDEDNSFNFISEGCYARAQKMALMMDDMDIMSGKIFAEGAFPMKGKDWEGTWEYHTASLIMVKKNKKLIPTVLDPALFDHPVTIDEWKAKLMKDSKSQLKDTFYTTRFIYNRENKNVDATDYSLDQIEDMNASLKEYLRAGYTNQLLDEQETKKDKK
jgi:hypothetical protein